MATKIIKAWIDGAIQEIEVEDTVSPEQPLSYDERLAELEDKPIITDGNLLVGNGTTELEELTPEEVLSHINGASVETMTTDEYEALEESNANTLYVLTDSQEEEYALQSDLESLQDVVAQKSQVQIVTDNVSEVLQTLKIHKLTQEEYEQKIANGTVDENALYLTPDEVIDLSSYATQEYVNNSIAAIPTPDVSGQIENHNINITAHEDIRNLITDLKVLVGDTVVSSQISEAVAQKTQVQIITWEVDD